MNEHLPDPLAPGILGGGTTDSILAQFFRERPSEDLNLRVNIPSDTSRVMLGQSAFNSTFASNGAEFPDGNSIRFNNSGDYLHVITVYGHSDKNGIIAMDVVDENGESYSRSAFALKNISVAAADPLILTALIHHNANQTARLRFAGASDGNAGLEFSIWAIAWSAKK